MQFFLHSTNVLITSVGRVFHWSAVDALSIAPKTLRRYKEISNANKNNLQVFYFIIIRSDKKYNLIFAEMLHLSKINEDKYLMDNILLRSVALFVSH